MRKSDIVLQRSLIIGCLVIFCFSAAGCEPLRKKFTRKKKEESKRIADPVLEPIDYPPMQTMPIERYKYSYSMWRVWNKDLLTSLNAGENGKRVEYLFEEMCAQFKEMDRWIAGEKKDYLNSAMLNYDQIRPSIQNLQTAGDVRSVMRKLERNAKDVRNNLSPEMIGDLFISAQ